MIYISPKACQYLVSTRINRIETETVFPCPPFLLFVLCLLSRSSWNPYAPIEELVKLLLYINYIIIYYYQLELHVLWFALALQLTPVLLTKNPPPKLASPNQDFCTFLSRNRLNLKQKNQAAKTASFAYFCHADLNSRELQAIPSTQHERMLRRSAALSID